MRTRADHRLFLATAILIAAGSFFMAGCADEAPQNFAAVPPILPPPPPPAPSEEPKEKPVYVYSGDRFRDPFVAAGTTGSYQPDAIFDPSKATVRGIIYGPASRSAVISTAGGGTYFIKAGKIFDIMGKSVEGFSAKVFTEKVVIMGEADNVFELKIRNDEEEKSL